MPLHDLQPLLGWTTDSTAPSAAFFMRQCWQLVMTLLLVGITAPSAAGADQPAVLGRTQDMTGQLRDGEAGGLRSRLASGTFDQRQQAMWELWRDRSQREAIAAAVRDPDPEVSRRAQWVLDRWRRGILVDTPAELTRQLEAISHSDSLQRLLDLGLFNGARVAIEEAIEAGDQATLARAQAVIERAFVFYVRSADTQGQLQEFAELVDRLATTTEMVICRQQLWERLGAEPSASFDPATRQTATRNPRDQQRAGIIALAVANRFDEACELARTAGDIELLRICQLLSGDWPGLAQSQLTAATEAAAGTPDSDRHWAYTLVAAARSGDTELHQRAVAALSKRANDEAPEAEDDPFVRLRWQVLAMHGEIDAAVEILAPTQPLVAAELLAQAGRLSDAMEIVGFAPEEIDGQLANWITAARTATAQWPATQFRDIPVPVEELTTKARLLFLAGRRDAAWELLAGVAAKSLDESEAPGLALARAMVLQTLIRLNRADWLLQMVLEDSPTSLSGTSRHFLARALDVQPETLDALTMALGQLRPGNPQALQAAIDLLRGKLPAGFDPQTDFQRLFDLLSTGTPVAQSREARWTVAAETPKLNLELAKLFAGHGQAELARGTLVHLAGRGETDALLELAESELEAGHVQSARNMFAAAWQRIDQQRQDPARLNRAEDDAFSALKAVVGEAVAAARLGDREGADELWRLLDLMTCTPSTKLRDLFGEYLLDAGFDQQAEPIYRTLMPWVAFGSDEGVEFYTVARNFNRALHTTDPVRAAEIYDLAIAGTIESTIFYPAAYVSLPAYVHRQSVLAAIEVGDIDSVPKHIDAIMRLNPIDIDFGEKALKPLREAGQPELAQQAIERIYQAGSAHLERFPLDIVTANNLAWILALSDHRLDDALRISQRAVYFAPDSTVYRDTLAEVLFRLGRADEAVAIAQACLLDQPGEWHVREQLRRFQTPKTK